MAKTFVNNLIKLALVVWAILVNVQVQAAVTDINTAETGYRIAANGGNQVIDLYSQCWDITSNKTKDLFVPTRTQEMYESFVNAVQTDQLIGVTLIECALRWCDDSFSGRAIITTDPSYIDSDLQNFPLYVNLADANVVNGDIFTLAAADGRDIRITSGDGNCESRSVEISNFNKTNNTGHIYFKEDTLSSTEPQTFHIYYGNPSAPAIDPAAAGGAQSVWSEGYIGVWHLDESSNNPGNRYADSGPNNLQARGGSGSTSGGADFNPSNNAGKPGVIGNSIHVNGPVHLFVANNSHFNFSGTTNMTIEAYIKNNSNYNPGAAVTGYTGLGGIEFARILNDNSSFQTRAKVTESNPDFGDYISTKYINHGAANNTDWHHLAFTTDKDNSIAYAYYDGAQSSSVGYTNRSTYLGNTYFGCHIDETNCFSDGFIDEIRISNIQRSSAWLDAGYNNSLFHLNFWNGGEYTPSVTTTPSSYSWSVDTNYGTCSASCDGGTQTRTVTCRSNADNSIVSDALCSGSKPDTSQTCNTQTCGSWVNVTGARGNHRITCNDVCSSVGLVAGVSPEGARCASGENRPASSEGIIDYTFGASVGFSSAATNTSIVSFRGSRGAAARDTGTYCYKAGQKQDRDVTDHAVGCYCD